MTPRRPRLPRRAPMPSRGRADILRPTELEERTDGTDEYGMLLTVFGHLPRTSRGYIARSFESLGLDKRITPTHQQAGTIPEMVFYGGLLAFNFVPYRLGKGFAFQSELLGGRLPGGSVGDFVIYNGPRRIAVFVHSFFHSVQSPFGGAAKVAEETLLYQRILGSGQADAVVMVNHPEDNMPLENGPSSRVTAEVVRAIRA